MRNTLNVLINFEATFNVEGSESERDLCGVISAVQGGGRAKNFLFYFCGGWGELNINVNFYKLIKVKNLVLILFKLILLIIFKNLRGANIINMHIFISFKIIIGLKLQLQKMEK